MEQVVDITKPFINGRESNNAAVLAQNAFPNKRS